MLDMVARARQVIVEGPAGTGKTYMAEAAARRHAAQGDRVLVVCFNRLLEEQLQAHLDGVDGVTVRRLHAEMERVAGVASPADGADVASDWYSTELPLRALDAATTAGFEPLYDYLVIDEAQDVATDVNLDFLDALLVGGLSLGRLLVLGDFSNQNIYKSGTGDSRAVFERRIPHATPSTSIRTAATAATSAPGPSTPADATGSARPTDARGTTRTPSPSSDSPPARTRSACWMPPCANCARKATDRRMS